MKMSSHTQLSRLTVPAGLRIQLGILSVADLVVGVSLLFVSGTPAGIRLFAGALCALGTHSLCSLRQAPGALRSLLLMRMFTAMSICLVVGIEFILHTPMLPEPLLLILAGAAAAVLPLWVYWFVRVGRLPQ